MASRHRERNEISEYVWNPITGTDQMLQDKIILNFSGDVRWNLGQVEKYEKRGDILVLNEPFVAENKKVLRTPFGINPTYYRYRLKEMRKVVHGCTVQVGTRGDIFQNWVPDWVLEEIFKEMENLNRHHYLFITDNPERYEQLIRNGIIQVKEHYWFGVSVRDNDGAVSEIPGNQFLYIVPEEKIEIEGYVTKNIKWAILDLPSDLSIEKAWVDNIIAVLQGMKIPIYMKKSLSTLYSELLKEQPEEMRIYPEVECMACKKMDKKKKMIRIFAEQKEVFRKQLLGFLCEECFEQQYRVWDKVEKIKELKEKSNEKN